MPELAKPDRFDRFIGYLEKLKEKEDRGALAALRRGLGADPGQTPEMYPYVFPYTTGMTRSNENACFIAASLFALHHDGNSQDTLGTVFRKIKHKKDSESIEQRFVALLNADKEDLPIHLRHAIALAKGEDIPIGWRELLKGIRFWDYDDRFIQRKWARDFWGYNKEIAEETE